MYDGDFSLEHNLTGWFGWLDDPDPEVRQYAARSASIVLHDCGLSWIDVARLVAAEVLQQREAERWRTEGRSVRISEELVTMPRRAGRAGR